MIARASSLRPAPTSPAMPRISPRMQGERCRRGARRARQALDAQQLAAAAARRRGIVLGEIAVGHQADELGARSPRRAARRDVPAVAQHGDPVADPRTPRPGGARCR